MRSFSLKLSTGNDLLASLDEIAVNENSLGYVLGIVGNLSSAAFQCPGQKEPEILHGELEIITLNGTISPKGSHLHLSVSDSACKVWGGHLEYGSKILKGTDLLLGLIEEFEISSMDYKKKQALLSDRVEIYILENCPWSKRSIRILSKLNIKYQIKKVSTDDEYQEVNKITNATRFPQILIDGVFIGGYESLVELNSLGKLDHLK